MFLAKNKKSGIWFIYFNQLNGKRTRRSTHTAIKKEALKFLKEYDKPKKVDITLKDFAEKYYEMKKVNSSISHFKGINYTLDNFIKSQENVLLRNISSVDAEKYILKVFEHSKHMAQFYLRNLKAAFNTAIKWDLIEKNPFKGIKIRIPENYPIYLTNEEIKMVVEKEKDPRLKCLYILMANTGCRTGEMLNLEWSDVDFINSVIKVQNKDTFSTKGKKQRNIPMNSNVLKILNNTEKRENGYIFNNNGKPLSISYASKKFKRSVRKAGLNDKYRLYHLRHSFASHLVQKSVSIYTVRQLLGHSSTVVTQRYAHLSNESLKDACNILNS